MLGFVPIGVAFGVLARTAGLSPLEIGLMSLIVYAGSSQFAAVALLGASPVLTPGAANAIIASTLLINLRHLLMSTALAQSLRRTAPWQNALLAYGITDETFAVASATLEGRPAEAGFLAGLNVTAQSAWVAATVGGALIGQTVGDARALGLDFALPAMFIGLLVPMLLKESVKPRALTAAVAAAAGVAGALWLPQGWGVVAAAVLAAMVGVMAE